MEEVARYECVYNRGRKDFKDKNKRPTVGTKSGRSFIYRPGKRRPNFATLKNCVRSLSNPKPIFSTVLELTTTRFMTKRRSKFACGKISALPRSRCCLLFSLHARVYLTFPLTKTYGYGRLCDRCNYMETAFFAIVCDCLRSAIVCDRLRLYGNQPLDRTWFYLLRSSAITIAGSQTIAEVFPYDRRPYCDLRSAICDPRSYGNQPLDRTWFYLLRSSAITIAGSQK